MTKHSFLFAAICSAMLWLSAGSVALAEILPSRNDFALWNVTCDNGLRCEAKGMTEKRLGADISILRDPGPRGGVHVRIAAAFDFELADLVVNEQRVNLDPSYWSKERYGGRTWFHTTNMRAARAFVEQVRNGSSLRFENRPDLYISLSGMTAALLSIDEHQQRLGTVTALIRHGSAPADAVPPPPRLPRFQPFDEPAPLTDEEQRDLLESILADHEDVFERCYSLIHDIALVEPQIWPLDDKYALAAIPCTEARLGQILSLMFIAEREQAGSSEWFQPMIIAVDPDRKPIFAWALPDPDFDPPTGRLFASQKYSGDAFCGVAGEWQWWGGEFVIAHHAAQRRCGGSGPGNWPVLFRSLTVSGP